LFQAIPKLALRAQTVGIAFLSLRQDLWIKNVSMSAQRDFCMGNNPSTIDQNLVFSSPVKKDETRYSNL
jgi:hypothetical protein